MPQLVEHALPSLDGIDAQVAEGIQGKVRAGALSRTEQAEQQVLGADVIVAQRPGLLEASASDCFASLVSVIRPVQLSRPWRQRHPLERAWPEALFDLALDLIQVDADRGQRLGIAAGRP